jgi:hypothetical protein
MKMKACSITNQQVYNVISSSVHKKTVITLVSCEILISVINLENTTLDCGVRNAIPRFVMITCPIQLTDAKSLVISAQQFQ